LADKVLSFQSLDTSVLTTDRTGAFVFPAQAYDEYEFYITGPGAPPVLQALGKIEVSDGQDVEMGNIVLNIPLKHEPMGRLLGPVTVTPFSSEAASSTRSRLTTTAAGVAAVFVGADGSIVILD